MASDADCLLNRADDLVQALEWLGQRASQNGLGLTAHLIAVAAETVRCGAGELTPELVAELAPELADEVA